MIFASFDAIMLIISSFNSNFISLLSVAQLFFTTDHGFFQGLLDIVLLFLVGAFLKKMSPTITVASFFFFFFFVRPQNVCVVDTFYRTTKSTEPASGITSELLQRVPLFVYSIFNVRYKTGRDYRVPPLIFVRHCATFFRIFFCRQTVPPSSFLIFCSKLKFQKAQRVPLSSFSAL